jgi:hypothetical protein
MLKHAALVIGAIVAMATMAAAHPTDGLMPNDLPVPYGRVGGGLPASWSINDLVFLDTYPNPDTLTDQEKYLIAGATDHLLNKVYFPWESEVQKLAERYYFRYGVLPSELSPQVIADAYGVASPNEVPAGVLDVLVSPLTGRYPRLDAVNPSPGDVFIHILTEQEKQHIAAQSEDIYDLWYNPQHYSSLSQKWISKDPQAVIAMYIRTYGWNGIINTSLCSSYVPSN